jgi:uncharacterized protein (DUF305 family)
MNKQVIIALIVGLIIGGAATFGIVSSNSSTTPNNNSMSSKPEGTNSMSNMDHGQGSSMDQMSMADMMSELDGKTGDEFDRTFIQAMIAHHQGAIDMANLAKTNAKREEIKKMSDDIISAQTSEIEMMKQWEKDWGYTQ